MFQRQYFLILFKKKQPSLLLNVEVIWKASDSSLTSEQCYQIGRVFKFLATNFVTKIRQMFVNSLGYYEKHHFLGKNCFGAFLGNFWKIRQLLIPRSVHTAKALPGWAQELEFESRWRHDVSCISCCAGDVLSLKKIHYWDEMRSSFSPNVK